MMTPFDWQMLRRSLVIGGCFCAVLVAVMYATDGRATTLAQKLGLLCVLAPVLVAVGALLSYAQALARGEALAAWSSGAGSPRACRGAAVAVVATGLVAAAGLTTNRTDLATLLPQHARAHWTMLTDGRAVLTDNAVAVGPSGVPEFVHTSPAVAVAAPRLALAATVVVLSVALAHWISYPRKPETRLLWLVFSGLLALALFHMVAAERLAAWALVLCAGPIALDGVVLAWRERIPPR